MDRLKVFTPYSSRFEPLFREFWEPSIPPSMALLAYKLPDALSEHGVPGREGTSVITAHIYDWMIALIEQHLGEAILFAGCDQCFFSDCAPDLLARLGDNDIIGADPFYDHSIMCGDFRVVRASRKVAALYKAAYSAIPCYWCDDEAMTAILKGHHSKMRHDFLPYQAYWHYGFAPSQWRDEFVIHPPREIVWYHAYFLDATLDQKAFMIRTIRERVRTGQFFSEDNWCPTPGARITINGINPQ